VLTRDGYRVSIVQQPLTGLDEDVAATKRVLDQQDGPVILVGHGYGGSIITVAGSDQSNDLKPTKDGFLFLDPAKCAADVGADLPKPTAEFMARSQMPVSGAALEETRRQMGGDRYGPSAFGSDRGRRRNVGRWNLGP